VNSVSLSRNKPIKAISLVARIFKCCVPELHDLIRHVNFGHFSGRNNFDPITRVPTRMVKMMAERINNEMMSS
jgi:hypothetical protein